MTTYELLLFAHLTCVVTWVGGTICLQVLALRARRSPDRMAEFLGDAEWVGHRLLAPASVLVVVFGVLLANEVGYDLSDTWILLAFAAFLLSFAVGAAYLDPESGRLSELVSEFGPGDPAVRRRIRRVGLVSQVELLILVAVILDMVTKPGL
jgi:uncharacterized membrane protein